MGDREGEKHMKGMKERKKEDEGLKFERNHSPLNFKRLFILVLKIIKERDSVTCQHKYIFLYLIMLLPVAGIM
jgi:hypothetical protein